MSLQRVLVFGNELLLSAGVANLLSREADLEIVNAMSGDTATLVEQIQAYRPDVVVLDEVTYLSVRTELLASFETYPELRVVMVSQESNLIQIYQGQQVSITQATDFVNIVRGCEPRP